VPTPVSRAPHRGSLWRQWTAALLLGELVGFLPPAVTGATLAAVGVSDVVLVAALTAAGTLEGAAVGAAQAWVLRRHAAPLDARRWVAATAAAAGFAWCVGMGGGALLGAAAAPTAVLLVLLVPAWTAGLFAMGVAQWLVMRGGVPGAGRWVWVTTGAWLVGVMIPVTALSAAPNGWPPAAHAVIGVVAAVAMGLTVGVLTGRTMQRLLAAAPRSAGTPADPGPGPAAPQRSAAT
jgi:hypothetical protein